MLSIVACFGPFCCRLKILFVPCVSNGRVVVSMYLCGCCIIHHSSKGMVHRLILLVPFSQLIFMYSVGCFEQCVLACHLSCYDVSLK